MQLSKLKFWLLTTLISSILGYAGYPWFYRQYINWSLKHIKREFDYVMPLEHFRTCEWLTIRTELNDVNICTAFYKDDMPKITAGYKAGDPFPFEQYHLQSGQLLNAYSLLIEARNKLGLKPIDPIKILSHGSL